MRLSYKVSLRVFNSCLITIALILINGCTTKLHATKVSDSEEAVEGHVYYLPRIEFSVNLERELKSCTVKFQEDGDGVIEWLRTSSTEFVKFKSEAELITAWTELLNDPILQRTDVITYLNYKLGSNWKTEKPPTEEERDAFENFINENAKTRSAPTLFLDVSMKAQAIPFIIPDEDHVYSIQYSGMQELLKGTNFSVENFPNGTLKSINITLDDQTGSIVQSSISGLAKLAASSAGFPIPTGNFHSGELKPNLTRYSIWIKKIQNEKALCNASTLLKVAQRDALTADVQGKAKIALELSELIAQLEKDVESEIKLKDQNQKDLDSMSADDPKRTALSTTIENIKATIKSKQTNIDTQKKSQVAAIESSNKASTQLDVLRKKLTVTSVTTFHPSYAENHVPLLGAEESLSAWLDREKVQEFCLMDDNICNDNWPGDTASKLNADAAIYPSFTKLHNIKAPTNNSIVYRQPIKSSLIICKENACLDSVNHLIAEPQNILLSSSVDIPQFGVLASLPLKNTSFQNNSLSASFTESGALTKLTYTTNAVASKATETLSSSAETFMKFKEAKSKEGKAKLDNSAAEVDARTKLLEAQLKQEQAQENLNSFRENKNAD